MGAPVVFGGRSAAVAIIFGYGSVVLFELGSHVVGTVMIVVYD